MKTDSTDLSIEVIEEFLLAARLSIEYPKSNGRNLGYAATLLLLSVADAMSHGQSQKSSPNVQFDVLNRSPLSLGLSAAQLVNLREWFRHRLSHTGQIVPGVGLLPGKTGQPFEFDNSGALIGIRVGVFFDLIRNAWDTHKAVFRPHEPHPNCRLPDPKDQTAGFASTLSPAASGVFRTPTQHGEKPSGER